MMDMECQLRIQESSNSSNEHFAKFVVASLLQHSAQTCIQGIVLFYVSAKK